MTIKTWSGADADYLSTTDWSPAGSPLSGDVAVINSGRVNVTGARIDGTVINLNQTSATGSSTLVLTAYRNETPRIVPVILASNTTVNVGNTVTNVAGFSNLFTTAVPTIYFLNGEVDNQGTLNFTANAALAGNAASAMIDGKLINTGSINIIATTVNIGDLSGQSLIENDGTISIVRARGPASNVAPAITGHGSIEMGANGVVEFDSNIANTQSIDFNGGSGQYEEVDFGNASGAAATIAGFSKSDVIRLLNTSFTTVTYASTGADSGTLTLMNGTAQIATLAFTGRYSINSFAVASNTANNGQPEVSITTTADEAQYGVLPAGYGYATRPIYRFFDTTDGTQFLTFSTNERDTVQATRPDLMQESGAFSAVASNDANATPIYRFFDTKFGTHFFTASAAERDSINAQRGDLVYEPSSTFFEHGMQQANDVAVHRFYETGTGTHFYTGSQAEYQALTTPDSGSYRSDFVSEGIAFYAPNSSAK